MVKNNTDVKLLSDNIKYKIMDNTIYLFGDIHLLNKEQLKLLYKKILLIIEDEEVFYINITSRNLEKSKSFYQKYGFSLSYYDVNKLNNLFNKQKKREEYRCYGFITKNDFLNIKFDDEKDVNKSNIVIKKDDSGFINSMFLLFGGILFLCYLCVQGAISLVK